MAPRLARIRGKPRDSSGKRLRRLPPKTSRKFPSSPKKPTITQIRIRGCNVADLAAHGAHPPGFAHQFEDMEQQHEAGNLGMWVFLVTEIMFFGGLFACYTIYRALHLQAFETGSRLLEVQFGATNTVVLIVSSLTMALAIRTAQTGKKKGTIIFWLILTMILGAAFIGIKLHFEWWPDWREGLVPGFHWFYNTPPHAAGVKMFMVF